MPKSKRPTAKADNKGKRFGLSRPKKPVKRPNARKARLLPSWRLFWVALRSLWAVKRHSLPLLLTHLALIVFVTNNQVGQSDGQAVASICLVIFLSMMYVTLLRAGAQENPQIRTADIVYGGPSQIVPFIILLSLSLLQVLPLAFGALIFQIAIGANIAILAWEQIAFGVIWFLMSVPSIYWLSSTLVSLVIVTIPEVKPLEAYQAAKNLVKGWTLAVAFRILVFGIVYLATLLGIVIAAFAMGREVFGLQVPYYLVAILVPLFWAYVFALYRNLLANE